MMNKKELALRALTLALTVSLAGAAVSVGTPTTAYAAETNTTQVSQEVEKWTPARVYQDMQLGQTWGDWDYSTADSGKFVPVEDRWHSTIHTEWLNDPHFVLAQERATTTDGIELKSMFLQPIDLDCIGRGGKYISHTNNTTPIKKWLSIESSGSVDPGETLWSYMQQMLELTVAATNATEIGNTYIDTYEDADYARFTFNVTRINASYNTIEKGYVTWVWTKAINKVTTVEYFESEGSYNSERALTVVYSYLPIW